MEDLLRVAERNAMGSFCSPYTGEVERHGIGARLFWGDREEDNSELLQVSWDFMYSFLSRTKRWQVDHGWIGAHVLTDFVNMFKET